MKKGNPAMIGITMGDPAGIGPELALKAWKEGSLSQNALIIGDFSVLSWCNSLLDFGLPLRRITDIADCRPGTCQVLDLGLMQADQVRIGQVDRLAGYAASEYVRKAVSLTLAGQLSALVTLPMNKEATRLSLPDFSGHTELIAGLCSQTNYAMMLTGSRLTVSHVSTHVSMAEAVRQVRQDRIYQVITLTHEALARYLPRPRLAVAGLNPHAGENGAFGREDQQQILPAVRQARQAGIECSGPLPPDTVFLKAVEGEFDAVVCMYHDQGHIPMKLLDFDGGVNVTLGLKIIRTSVDHGTAYDIAYQNKASTRSLAAAFGLAEKMVQGQQATSCEAR